MAGGQFPAAAGNTMLPNNLFQPDIWSLKLLRRYYEESVVPSITNMDYEGEIKEMGDRVRIRREPEISITRYQKGQGVTNQDITDEEVQFVINYGGFWSVAVNDIDRKQSDVAWVESMQRNAARQQGRWVDEQVLGNIYADAASANQLTSRTVTPNTIPDLIIECSVALDTAYAPEEDRWIVVPYWFAGHLKLNETFVSAEKMGDDVSIIRNGKIGKFDRFTVYCSPWLPTVSTYTVVVFGSRSAVTFATQYVKTETLRNQNDFGDILRGLQVFGWKTVQSTHLGKVGVLKG